MKFQTSNFKFRIAGADARRYRPIRHSQFIIRHAAAFTLVEIAICLAIVSFALIAIIGVLPLGMDTQRQVREETVINQDATMLLEAIRNGNQIGGGTDLANYVYAIQDEAGGTNYGPSILTSSQIIVGLLSTPGGGHMVASVQAMSGLAAQESPQTNSTILNDAFSYKVVCVNVPAQGVNNPNNLHELRMTFLWPILPNGQIGSGRQTFRATIAGQLSLAQTNPPLWYYQPQKFQ